MIFRRFPFRNRSHRRFFVFLIIDGIGIMLHENEENFAMTTLSIGHTLGLTIQVLDQFGNVMLSPVTYDAAPTWSNSTPATETLAPAADGQSAVATPVAVGDDVISLALSIDGKPLTATLAVTVTPVVQVPTSIAIVATVN